MTNARNGLSLLNVSGFRLILIGFTISALVNAEYFRIHRSFNEQGVLGSVFNTFGISVITIFGIIYAAVMAFRLPDRDLDVWDYLVFPAAFALVLIPATGLSSVAVTMVGLYLYVRASQLDVADQHRDLTNFSLLLIALSYNIMWSPFIFHFFMPYILQMDAALVGLFAGATVDGNLVYAPDGSTVLQVGSGCSSFNNLSLAVVVTTLARCMFGIQGKKRTMMALFLSIFLIVAINVVRIGLIALFPAHYELIHGTVGATIANYTMTISLYLCAVIFLSRTSEAKSAERA